MKFCVLDEAPEDLSSTEHIPIYDAASDRAILRNLDRLAVAIGAARSDRRPVLVFCGHGIRRSPLAAAWYLHRTEGITLDAAFARIRSARPGIETAREWIGDLSDLEGP
ncbi:MAG TPA: dual specificity protein phosphatase [Thermoplasmata archaeon]|nr:dual specificity protein phosphatase [Thermoplasmata archaeon]